ncbi:MAG: diguanylate cyclase response regulator [Phycisphaeraceae bacterium]|nr:MAG: diguanylate cyclase response regulator [Phycisphaeraceae bacterium]
MTHAVPHQPEDAIPVVLVIDDCVDVHRLLSVRLGSEAIELVSAHSGEEGLTRAGEVLPSLILLDLDMPGIDGFEVLRRVKDDAAISEIPVIVLSGMQSPHDKVTAFDLGAVDFVGKPFDMAELRARVRSALRLHSLMRMLAQRAQIDGLTGLWNRSYFEERWTNEAKRARRHDHPLSLAVLDLDSFKQVNDSYGHPAGDAVLQGLSRVLKREIRGSDVACRYGGEEFALIMPDTTPEAARALCDRVRAMFEGMNWPRHPGRNVTFSCGVAGASVGVPVDAPDWLEIADANLYAAKRGGRNRVIATDLTPEDPGLRKAG